MKKFLIPLLAVAVFFSLIIGYEVADMLPSLFSVSSSAPLTLPNKNIEFNYTPSFNPITLALPAANKEGQGALATLSVSVSPGDGKIFIEADAANPLVNPDTQESVKLAARVAKGVVGPSANNYNIYYNIIADSGEIGGKSAGAALAIATIAALRGEKLKPGILITGALQSDGAISPVGKVVAKAQAVKKGGYSTLLVPVGESVENVPKENCTKKELPNGVYESCTTIFEHVSVANETGISVIEVSNLEEAYNLMRAS